MPDREKVYGFELCANGEPCIGEKFIKCPFSPRNNAEQNCGVTMAKTAIELLKEQQQQIWELQDLVEYFTDKLKEQEAVEPLPPESEIGTLWRCGSCRREIGYKYHFCQWCGQAVKWE